MAKKRATNKKSSNPWQPTPDMVENLRLQRMKQEAQLNRSMQISRSQMAASRAAGATAARQQAVKNFQGASRLTSSAAAKVAKSGEFNKYLKAQSAESVAAQQAAAVKVPKNPLSGRTVEFGTRSMLQGLRSWIRGGGGSILRGR